jgi:hypothetical protein
VLTARMLGVLGVEVYRPSWTSGISQVTRHTFGRGTSCLHSYPLSLSFHLSSLTIFTGSLLPIVRLPSGKTVYISPGNDEGSGDRTILHHHRISKTTSNTHYIQTSSTAPTARRIRSNTDWVASEYIMATTLPLLGRTIAAPIP